MLAYLDFGYQLFVLLAFIIAPAPPGAVAICSALAPSWLHVREPGQQNGKVDHIKSHTKKYDHDI
jgi:hypothetical protein